MCTKTVRFARASLPGGLLLALVAFTAACGQQPTSIASPDAGAAADPEPVLETCPDREKSEQAFKALKLLDHHGPIATTREQRDRLAGFLQAGDYQDWCHDHFRDLDLRMTGPIAPVASRITGEAKSTAFSTHSRVRVYYSNDMLTWLANGREGEIPDGAAMVKEMHPSIADKDHKIEDIDGFAVMVRDKSASKEGWLWYLHYEVGNSAYSLPFRAGQYGNSFCLSCHAAATAESTFADWGNLAEVDVPTYLNLPGGAVPRATTTHGRIPADLFPVTNQLGTMSAGMPEDWNLWACGLAMRDKKIDQDTFYACVMNGPITEPLGEANAFVGLFEKVLDDPAAIGKPLPRRLPQDLLQDHLPPGPDGPEWLSASACNACHEASDLLNGTNAEMSVSLQGRHEDFDHLYAIRYANEQTERKRYADKAALSPFAEWSGSLMSVSARDPVFRAQLEWETQAYPEKAEETTKLCLSCHAPAGERAQPALATDLNNTYANAYDNTPEEAHFGALARDGVTCVICHRMTDKDLGKPESFTAHFELGDPSLVNGPFAEHIQTDPMQTALGVTPQHAAHLSDSGLCGTCHMVDTPVYDNDEMEFAHEQTTYLEWKASDFALGDDPQSCQSCHMPNTNPLDGDTPTRGKIANYEDSEFPFVPNRKPAALVDTQDRDGYRRHTLVGINLFTMNLFQQFPYLLGSHSFNPSRQFAEIVPPKAFATHEAVALASEATADIALSTPKFTDKGLAFDVTVTNKAGHKFPTGVGFRRAWIEVTAYDDQDKTLWCSGCTTETGMITDTAGTPLSTEVAIQSTEYQEDYTHINADTQVQIYETRHINNAGYLTTSFVELDKEVKDNRLLPRGFKPELYPDHQLAPVEASFDADRPERDTVTYQLPADISAKTTRVTASLYYQALPPYYLLDRASLLADKPDLPETQRLLHMLLRLNLDAKTHGAQAIRNWRLQISEPAVALINRSKGSAAPAGR